MTRGRDGSGAEVSVNLIFHVFRCPRQTQHLRFETFFRLEDHTDWERAPASYDPVLGKSRLE